MSKVKRLTYRDLIEDRLAVGVEIHATEEHDLIVEAGAKFVTPS